MDRWNGAEDGGVAFEPVRSAQLPAIDDGWLAELARENEDEGLLEAAARAEGALAAVHFDPPSAKSGSLVALVHHDDLPRIERRRYVTMICKGDGRRYIGRIAEGPFFTPDVLKAESTPVKFIVINQGRIRGKVLTLPEYHGVIVVEILGEERGGEIVGATRRPHPGSPIFAQDSETMAAMFNLGGNLVLGHLDGYPDVPLALDGDDKDVAARHFLTSGTSGSGKSNTNQVLMEETLAAGFAQVVLDPEGEYILMDQPATGADLVERLAPFARTPVGVADLCVYRPPKAESKRADAIPFSVPFDSLAPEVIMELTDMTGPQQLRFPALYEQAITLLKRQGSEEAALGDREDADISRGFPGVTLALLLRMLDEELAYYDWKKNYEALYEAAEKVAKEREKRVRKGASRSRAAADPEPEEIDEEEDQFAGIPPKPDAYFRTFPMPPLVRDHTDAQSFGGLRKHLRGLARLGVFDQPEASPLNMEELAAPGRLSVIDLSDTDDRQLMNIIVADLLARMFTYKMRLSEEENARRKVMLTIEEAHGFVPRERLDKMEQTFNQLRRIMRRGRKRWLVMHFVTQSPQHLPAELFELANNKIIHQTTGSENLRVLRQAVGSVNEAIWEELPTLGRGRAIVASGQYPHPLIAHMRLAASRRNYSR